MNNISKMLLALFCSAFFVVRTKMSHELQQQVDQKSSEQVRSWDGSQTQKGEFVKKRMRFSWM